jgi:signal transduction histidine kinase
VTGVLHWRRWWLVGIAVLGAAWGLGGEWVSISHGVPENHLLDALTGLGYFLGGVVALDRRPGNRLGPIMVLLGVTWFCGNWAELRWAWLLPMLNLGTAVSAALLAHLLLGYPSGRLGTAYERALVVAAYVVTLGTTAGALLTLDPAATGCTDCPPPPALWPDATVSAGFARVGDDAALVLGPLFLLALALRWRRATAAARRELAPLGLAAALLATVYLLGPFGGSDPDGFGYLLWELRAVLQILVPVVFLVGLLTTRFAQSAIGGLVVDLQDPVPPGQLRSLLARTLADPGLDVASPLGEGRWADADGASVPPPTDGAATLVERDGRPLAALRHDPALDPALVRAAAAATGMAIENERLHAELRAQLEEVRASRERIVRAGDEERRRVERDLHDGAQQRLVGVALALHTAQRQLGLGDRTALSHTLEQAAKELGLAIDELRELARGIHPTVLTDAGLAVALPALGARSPVPVDVVVAEGRFAPTVEATAWFVVSEALTNVAKHAGASRAWVTAEESGDVLAVEVRDDGAGGADPARGSGLRGLQDRVAAVGGTLRVESPNGGGTVVRLELPRGAR